MMEKCDKTAGNGWKNVINWQKQLEKCDFWLRNVWNFVIERDIIKLWNINFEEKLMISL